MIQFSEEPLARYGVTYERDHRKIRQVTRRRIFGTGYQSPQHRLLGLNPTSGDEIAGARPRPAVP